jgi:hypothetical protein
MIVNITTVTPALRLPARQALWINFSQRLKAGAQPRKKVPCWGLGSGLRRGDDFVLEGEA